MMILNLWTVREGNGRELECLIFGTSTDVQNGYQNLSETDSYVNSCMLICIIRYLIYFHGLLTKGNQSCCLNTVDKV